MLKHHERQRASRQLFWVLPDQLLQDTKDRGISLYNAVQTLT